MNSTMNWYLSGQSFLSCWGSLQKNFRQSAKSSSGLVEA